MRSGTVSQRSDPANGNAGDAVYFPWAGKRSGSYSPWVGKRAPAPPPSVAVSSSPSEDANSAPKPKKFLPWVGKRSCHCDLGRFKRDDGSEWVRIRKAPGNDHFDWDRMKKAGEASLSTVPIVYPIELSTYM